MNDKPELPEPDYKFAYFELAKHRDRAVHLLGKDEHWGENWIEAVLNELEAARLPRPVNEMFHIANGRLVKTSNNQPIPNEEPVFILRGRDNLSAKTIAHYIVECVNGGNVPEDRLKDLFGVLRRFVNFANRFGTKTPGITHGK